MYSLSDVARARSLFRTAGWPKLAQSLLGNTDFVNWPQNNARSEVFLQRTNSVIREVSRLQQQGEVEIGGAQAEPQADTGINRATENVSLIFEPFLQPACTPASNAIQGC